MPSNDAQYSYNLLINLVNSVNKESKKLEDSKKRLNQKTNNVKKLEEKLRGQLEKRDRLKDPFLDYAVYHYGINGAENLENFKGFLKDIYKYAGQMILENHASYSWGSTRFNHETGKMDGGKVDERILIGRLTSPSSFKLDEKNRQLLAEIDNLKSFTKKEGWKKEDKTTIFLDDYLPAYFKGISQGESDLIVKRDNLKNGIRINIYSPKNPEVMIGGSTTYDSEPHLYLVIGEGAVKDNLLERKHISKLTNRLFEERDIPRI